MLTCNQAFFWGGGKWEKKERLIHLCYCTRFYWKIFKQFATKTAVIEPCKFIVKKEDIYNSQINSHEQHFKTGLWHQHGSSDVIWDGLYSVLILTSQKYVIMFQIDVDGPEDTSLDEILSVMDEIQKELMDEGQNSW